MRLLPCGYWRRSHTPYPAATRWNPFSVCRWPYPQLAISSESLKTKNPRVWQTCVPTLLGTRYMLGREGHRSWPQLSASCVPSAIPLYTYWPLLSWQAGVITSMFIESGLAWRRDSPVPRWSVPQDVLTAFQTAEPCVYSWCFPDVPTWETALDFVTSATVKGLGAVVPPGCWAGMPVMGIEQVYLCWALGRYAHLGVVTVFHSVSVTSLRGSIVTSLWCDTY